MTSKTNFEEKFANRLSKVAEFVTKYPHRIVLFMALFYAAVIIFSIWFAKMSIVWWPI